MKKIGSHEANIESGGGKIKDKELTKKDMTIQKSSIKKAFIGMNKIPPYQFNSFIKIIKLNEG